ncbi:peroxisomal membrane protein PEX16 [Mucor ambiguus]|uniref:Peroxisomal membrane protein PEX16 n=1 Tax=Mucor ambiguus TaxID=91626 RepID=A0A0C9MMK5_9FUNG|nr:peroxisomal membrane protein PEX16 [Mucor ambiguus]
MLPSSLLHFSSKHKNNDSTSNYSTYIDTIEDALRALSLLLPGRFEDSDLCSQAVLAGLNLVSLYHTKFLVRKSNYLKSKNSSEDDTVVESFNAQFSRNNESNWPSKTASSLLSVISYTEVLAEMLLNRKVPKSSKWKFIASLEGLKGILRLVIFYGTRRQMILHPTHFIRNVDTASLEIANDEKFELTSLDPRTGTALSSTQAAIEKINSSRNNGIRGWAHLSELLWIVRPFVYAWMIYLRQKRARKHDLVRLKTKREDEMEEGDEEEDESIEKDDEGSWKPWLVSLSIDIASRIARHMQPLSPLEHEESKRRDYLFIYYLFRGPLYLKFTRLVLDAFCDATEHRPLISIVTAAINDYRPFWEDSYFYTAGS